MFNLFDILQNAQGGQAMQNLAKTYGLSPEQTQAAVEALLPAFSMGLQRTTTDPTQLQSLFGMMNASPHRSAFEDAMAAFGQQSTVNGNDLLGALFGSKDMSRAIADQAATMSGVGANVLKSMLPVLASMLAGGISQTAQNASAAQPNLQDLIGQMMGSMMGGGQPAAAPRPTQVQPNENGGGLLGALLGSILAQGNFQTGQAAPASPPAVNPADIFGQMFDTGREVQKANLDQMQSIFETFLGGRK
jgi:hypothetical protein